MRKIYFAALLLLCGCEMRTLECSGEVTRLDYTDGTVQIANGGQVRELRAFGDEMAALHTAFRAGMVVDVEYECEPFNGDCEVRSVKQIP